MAITEYAIGAATIDVSSHSGFLEVLEGQVRRIQQNTNMGSLRYIPDNTSPC